MIKSILDNGIQASLSTFVENREIWTAASAAAFTAWFFLFDRKKKSSYELAQELTIECNKKQLCLLQSSFKKHKFLAFYKAKQLKPDLTLDEFYKFFGPENRVHMQKFYQEFAKEDYSTLNRGSFKFIQQEATKELISKYKISDTQFQEIAKVYPEVADMQTVDNEGIDPRIHASLMSKILMISTEGSGESRILLYPHFNVPQAVIDPNIVILLYLLSLEAVYSYALVGVKRLELLKA
jgi:hypothetical protein